MQRQLKLQIARLNVFSAAQTVGEADRAQNAATDLQTPRDKLGVRDCGQGWFLNQWMTSGKRDRPATAARRQDTLK